jgi:endonuclease YncB( thermonuclease family)
MLKEGLAWHYKEHDSNPRYARLEAEAKQAGLGLWSDDRAVPPWEWRHMSKYERDGYR